MNKVTKQFGLARRSSTFLLDAGVAKQRQTKVQLSLNVLERFEYGAFGVPTLQFFFLQLYFLIATIFILNTYCQMHYIFCCMAYLPYLNS